MVRPSMANSTAGRTLGFRDLWGIPHAFGSVTHWRKSCSDDWTATRWARAATRLAHRSHDSST
eukprot:2921240-Pyramimonas_sp.AAC.1